MRAGCRRLIRNGLGAVAPTVALSLFGLIGVGGIAFDYARLASMDTELQNAADQAALAAATQLDGDDGACGRAIQAASTRLVAEAPWLANETRFANDGDGLLVQTTQTGGAMACTGNPNVTFYEDEDMTIPATTDAVANFVQVEVVAREANYALTPVVGALSGSLAAKALAGMQGSFCRIPPMMICNPAENAGEFNADDYAGKGILLKARGGGNAWAPGDFGFLAADYDFSAGGEAGMNVLRKVLGQENALISCVSGSRVTTEPGNMENVVDALNTRFDIYTQGGIANNAVCGSGQCPPDANTRSDLVRPNTAPSGNNCRPNPWQNEPNWNGNIGWSLPPKNRRYFAETASNTNLAAMGFPRDRCHASWPQNCDDGRIGDGTWDADAYFRTNYGWDPAGSGTANDWTTQTGLDDDAKRFDVYTWELTQARNPRPVASLGSMYAHNRPICQASPAATTDRRKLTVAVVNCSGLAGRQTRRPVSWIEVFLLEPSIQRHDVAGNERTRASDVYIEVIGKAEVVGEAGVTSVVRSVPYLVR
jgi:Flp pilus assembly protein TadG